jgi:hypothetical protein
MKTNININKQKGFLDIQLSGMQVVLGILGAAALIAMIPLVSGALSDSLYSGHNEIVNSVRSNYRSSASFNGLNNTNGVTIGVAPAPWMSGTASIVNNLGGAVTLSPEDISGTDDGFSIAHAGLDDDECREFVNDLYPGSYTITVGSTTVKAAGSSTPSMSTLITACSNATNIVTPNYTKF